MLLSSCSSQVTTTTQKPIQIELGQRIFIADSSLNTRDNQYSALRDSFIAERKYSDSLYVKLILANAKVEKVTKYLNICKKNPKQDQFLKGWISRALK